MSGPILVGPRARGVRRGRVLELQAAMAIGPSSVIEFVFENSTPVPECGCWFWDHGTRSPGYGVIRDPRKPINRKTSNHIGVPRLVCEMTYGPMGADVLPRAAVPWWEPPRTSPMDQEQPPPRLSDWEDWPKS